MVERSSPTPSKQGAEGVWGRRQTLIQVAVRNAGVRGGTRALGLVFAWVVWMDMHGGEAPAFEIFAGGGEKGRATWYRDLAAFKKAFPGVRIEDLAEATYQQVRRRGRPLASRPQEELAAELYGIHAYRVGALV